MPVESVFSGERLGAVFAVEGLRGVVYRTVSGQMLCPTERLFTFLAKVSWLC